MQVKVSSIISQFNKQIPFLQPLYEAIVNSLEANANNIEVVFNCTNVFMLEGGNFGSKITGFTITDDGDGFSKKNLKSFNEYLSTYKQDFGCKGIGRFTWLKVFENVTIESYTGKEYLNFEFNKKYKEELIYKKKSDKKKKTKITFENVTSEFYISRYKGKTTDKREIANINEIRNKIENHLLVKLYHIYKEEHRKFNIKLILGNEEKIISDKTIPHLGKKTFFMYDDISNNLKTTKHCFSLYYKFDNDQKGLREYNYCASGRIVSSFPESLKVKNLQDNESVTMFLTSKYLDIRVNNERNEFNFNMSDNNASFTNPVPGPQINEKLKRKIEEIIIDRYPSIIEDNKRIVEETINKNPHLAKYIKSDNSSLIKTEPDLVDKASKKYESEKEKIRFEFERTINNEKLNRNKLLKQMEKVNEFSARELAKYFLYRENIIKGLKKLHEGKSTIESDLHNLFMKMRTNSLKTKKDYSVYDSNIWLLDDKYMSYTEIFSDTSISKIKKEIAKSNQRVYGDKKEPDLTIFFNKTNSQLRDLVVVEFKALDTRTDSKMSAITEIKTNLGFILKSIDNVRNIYGYVITKMDKDFCAHLDNLGDIKPLFTNGNEPLYYHYYNGLKDKNNNEKDAHIFFLSSESICSDAETRNQPFLDIIKDS